MVKGDAGLPPGEVESLITESVPKGTCLLSFDGRLLTQRLKEKARVATAHISRRFPNTLVVELIQREPVAVIKEGAHNWQCDEEGTILEEKGHQTEGLPVIELKGSSPDPLGPGVTVRGGNLEAALQAINFLRETGGELPEKISFPPLRGMEMQMSGGSCLRLGPPVRLEQKLTICLKVMEKKGKNGKIGVVDVSCPDFSYYEVLPQ